MVNIEQIREWAREGGAIAMRHYAAPDVRRKSDRSYVTDADTAIERRLREHIHAAYPDHGILGEEERSYQPDAEYVWAIDPIDGTGSFVHSLPIWGVSIGLMRDGQPIAGCFYMPATDEWYEVDQDGPPRWNGVPIEVAHDNLLDSESYLCVPSNIHRRYTIDYPGKTRSMGSLAAYLCYVARGSAAGALLGRPKLWDIAAGAAILRRAGGDLRLLSGAPIDLPAMLDGSAPPEPVIAGSPAMLDMLCARIRLR